MSDTSPSSSLGSQGQTPRSRIPVASYRLRSPATPDSNGRAASPAATVYPRRQSSGSSSTTAIHASASQHSVSHYSRGSPTTSFISTSTRCSSPSTIHQRATSPRSPQSNEAVKSPSASLERRSIDAVKSLTCGGSSTGHGGARAASIGSFASIREKRISGPVFQDASVVGLEPAVPAAEDPHAHAHSPLPWQRQRLLSTAHEVEDEGSGAEPSPCTPTDGRSLADGGLKSRFSQSPGPERSLKGAPSKTAIAPGFGVAARLRKSLGVGDRSRSNSPLPPSRSQSPALSTKPPKTRKVLGGLNLKRVETTSDDAVLTGTTAAAAATHSWDGSNYSRHSQQTFKSSHSGGGGGGGGWREKERERERAGSRASSFKRALHKTSKSIKERLGSKTPQPDGGQEESPPPIPTRKPGLYADVLERLSYDQGRNSIAPYRAPLGNIADPLPPPLASTSPERAARTKKGSLPTQRRPLLLGKARRSRTVSVTASTEHSAPLVPATIRDSWIDMADDVRRQGGQVAVNGKARSAKKSEGGAGWYATWKKKSRRSRRRAEEEDGIEDRAQSHDLPPSALYVKPYVIAPERPPTLPSLRPAAPSPIESDFRFSTLWDSAKSAAPRASPPAPGPTPPAASASPSAPQRALLLSSLNGLDDSPRRIKALPQRSRGAPPSGGLPPLPSSQQQQQQHQRSHAAFAFKSPPPAPALPTVTEASPPSVAPTPTGATSPAALFTPGSNASLLAPRTGTDSLPVPPPRPRNPHATRVSKGSASSSLSGVNIDPSTSVGASAAKTSARSATTVGSSILFSSCDVELALGRLLDEAIAKQRRERREAQRQSKAQERAQSSSAEKRREREKALGDLTRRATGKTREGQSGWSDDESEQEVAGQSDAAAPGETIDQQLVTALARYLRLSRSPRSVRSTTHRDREEEPPLDVSNADVAAVTATLQRLVSQYRSTPLSTPSHRRSHRSATRTTGHTHSVTSPLSSGRFLRTPERRRVAAAPGSGSSLFSSAYYSRQSSGASVVLTPEKWRRGEEKRHERRRERERERGSSKRSSIAHGSAHAGTSSSTTTAPAPASHKSGSMTHSLDTHSVLSYTSTRLSATSSSGAGEDITSLLETMMESDVDASRVGVSPMASPSRKRKESGVDVTVAAMQMQQQRGNWPPALESNTTSPSLPAVSLTPLQESTLVFGNPRSSFAPTDEAQHDHHQQQQASERNGSTPLKSILRFYEQAQPDWRENAPTGLAPTAMLADSQGSPCSKRRLLRASSSHNVNANINVAHAAQPSSGHSQQAPPASLPAYDGSPRRLPSAAAAASSSATKRSSRVVRRPRPGMPAAAPQGSPRVTRAVAAARAAAAAEAASRAQAEAEREREPSLGGVAVHRALLPSPSETLFSATFAPAAIKQTIPTLSGKELSSPLQLQLRQHHHPQTPESELPLTPPWTGGRRQGQPRLGAISDPGTMPPLPTNTMAGGQTEDRGRGHAFLSPPAVVITDADVEAKFRALSVTPAAQEETEQRVGSSSAGKEAGKEDQQTQEGKAATSRRRKVKRGEQSTASSTGSTSTSSPSPPPPGSAGQQGVLQQAGSPFR